jgi:hypothetical protein
MAKYNAKIDLTQLRSVLDYDPETGIFKWKVQRRRCGQIGQQAGNKKPTGYRLIGVLGGLYWEHRLAWFYIYGVWPKNIDHINGVKDDNRIANLRDVTPKENAHNTPVKEKSITRMSAGNLPIGVLASKGNDTKWVAVISVDGKHVRSGPFDTMEEAFETYMALKKHLHQGYIDR